MGTGRIGRSTRHGLAAAVLGGLVGLPGAVLLAPSASAAPTVTIGTSSPAPVSVAPGQSVTFVNGIPTGTITVVPGPVPVTATLLTNAILGGPCGGHTLAPGASYSQTFSASATCPITYAYAVQPVPQAPVSLPPLPGPVQAVINVVEQAVSNPPAPPSSPLPLPSPPSLPLPSPPSSPLPLPSPGTPTGGNPAPAPAPAGSTGQQSGGSTAQQASGPPLGSTTSSQSGSATGTATGRTTPVDLAAAARFDPARYHGTSGGSGSGGSGTRYDGASVPVFGQLAGLDRPAADSRSAQSQPRALGGDSAPGLPVAALAAVVALAVVTAVLVRTHLAARAVRG